MSTSIELGNKVECIITGIVGIAVARVEYLNGCVQFCVQPRGAMDALKTDSLYIDEGQLKRINIGILAQPRRGRTQRTTGGPSAHTPRGQGQP